MKKLLSILFALISFAAFAQPGSLSQSVYRSRVNDSTTINGATASGYGYFLWNNQKAVPSWQFWNGTSLVDWNPSSSGGGAVSSVFTRTGAVTAQSGDYTVAQVTGAAPLASPTFTGTVTMPTPFTLGATSVTSTGTQLNYLNAATGTTGTASTNLVYSASPALTGTPTAPTPSAADNSTKIATTAYVDDAVLLTEAYGQIYSASTFSGTTGFTNNGTSVSVVSNTLEFISGAPTVAQTLDYDYVTALEYWKQEGTFKVLEKDADSYGFGLGINSANTYAQFEVFGRFDMTTGANTGKVLFTNDQNTDIATSTAALTFSVNDVIQLTVERFENVVIVTAKNVTTDADAVSVQYNYSDFPNQHPYQPNTGKFAILSRGGQFQLSALTLSSSEVKNAEIMMIGDSKVVGYNVTSQNSRIATLLKNNIASVVVNAGGSDRTADVLLRTDEIIALAPKRVLLAIGSNDIRSGVAEATYEANYDNIVTTLEAAGITVIHLLPFRELIINQIPLRDHITATYTAAEIIDTYSVLTNAMIDASVHPTTIGNYNLYNKIVTSNKLGAIRTSPYSFAPTGAILYSGYKSPANDANFTYDGLGLMIGAPVATRHASSIMHAYISTNAGRYVLAENASTGTASFIGFSMKSGARQSFIYQTPTTYTNANFSDASVWQSHFNTNLIMTTDGSNAHFKIGLNGKLTVYNTVTAGGTTGAQTINKASGTVNFATAETSLVVTNSLVTTSSIVFCTIRTNDATAVIKNVVPASGSFTITLNAATTAETSVGFLVIN